MKSNTTYQRLAESFLSISKEMETGETLPLFLRYHAREVAHNLACAGCDDLATKVANEVERIHPWLVNQN